MDLRWRKKGGTGENCMRSFLWFVLLTKCYRGDQIIRRAMYV
jgi:hypothetical protein